MPRVKRGTVRAKKRRNILAKTKGYKWGRKHLVKQAKTAANKAGAHSFKDRRLKKRNFRQLWQIQINAALRENHQLSYSKFIDLLNKKNIKLDRKILAKLAGSHPEVFAKVVEKAK